MNELRAEAARLRAHLNFKAGERLLLRFRDRRRLDQLERGWACWVALVKAENAGRMEADASQWMLHAEANASRDLQAWYHATFATELYRLRGSFWYKEAILPEYDAHPIEGEGDASAILCSANAIYTAMAATMYTIRATLDNDAYGLFEQLTTDGVVVLKHPFRSGRPQKKQFQLSLVQGDLYLFMYLTWKGKHGMQGIELASVDRITAGLDTDVLKRTAKVDKEGCYLSLVTHDRSLDLCFDSPTERHLWETTMADLVKIEKQVRAHSVSDAGGPPVDSPNLDVACAGPPLPSYSSSDDPRRRVL